MIRRLLNRFRPKPPCYGGVTISPLAVLASRPDALLPEHFKSICRIAGEVTRCQSVGQTFRGRGICRQYFVVATWDIDSDRLNVLTLEGGRPDISWTGTPAAFLAGGMDTPPPTERKLELVVDASVN